MWEEECQKERREDGIREKAINIDEMLDSVEKDRKIPQRHNSQDFEDHSYLIYNI